LSRKIINIAKLNVVEEVVKKIESIWNKTTIPIVSEMRAKTNNEYWKILQGAKTNYKSKKVVNSKKNM
jgi:hypothetical protein